MSGSIATEEQRLIWRNAYETLQVEPWGKDSVRVRISVAPFKAEQFSALLAPETTESTSSLIEGGARLLNGKLVVELSDNGHLCFRDSRSGEELLAEVPTALNFAAGRSFKTTNGDKFQAEARFCAYNDEHIYGMGQHQHGLLDQKGCVIDIMQRNTEVTIPFIVSSRKYGFLWNNPANGRVEFGANGTRWVANSTHQIDYFVTTGDTYPEIMEHYAAATGFPQLLPEWAAGFWQSKLRYASQAEVLEIAREYRRRNLPLAGIIIDAFHWNYMGDFRFDPQYWPNPAEMIQQLEEMGIKSMISIWPHANTDSRNYPEMLQKGYFVRTKRGVLGLNTFRDVKSEQPLDFRLYDPTNPAAREFMWEQAREGYYKIGIKSWWLDACEPEITNFDIDNLLYYSGDGTEQGCLYPLKHQQTFFEGMQAEGENEILLLCRSAWAGSQKYGAAVWSGDIYPTFEALRAQVAAGLNIAMSGIPWWTTDIGGFLGGNAELPEYRELMVRWFQYGVFCPLFRLHGFREPLNDTQDNGAPNEVWSYGEEAYKLIVEQLHLRERLKPYLMEQMKIAHTTGTPPMRPLFFDFPTDSECYNISDQFMFGPDILVAPILELNLRQRTVYLPNEANWRNIATGEIVSGGQYLEVDAPLERIPVFVRSESKLSF